MNNTIPTSAQIGTAMERIARTLAVLIAATIAAYATTQSGIRAIATLIRRLTTHPLRTLIDLVPTVPEPAPESLLVMLGAELLTDAEMAAEIAQYDASAKRKRAATVRRKPAGARKPAVVA